MELVSLIATIHYQHRIVSPCQLHKIQVWKKGMDLNLSIHLIAIFPVRFLKWLKKGLDWTLAWQIFSSSLCFSMDFLRSCSIWVLLQQWRKDCMRPCASLSQSNEWFKLGLIQSSMHWMRFKWRSRMVMIWYFDNKSPRSINNFVAIYLKWTFVVPGWCLSSFSVIGCLLTSPRFPTFLDQVCQQFCEPAL